MRRRWNGLIIAAAVWLAAIAAVAQEYNVTASQAVGELEQAKQLTNQKKYAEAVAKVEAALAKLKTLRDTPPGQADIAIVSIFQQGESVTVVVKNMGTANYETVVQGNTFFPNLDIQLYMVPTGGGADVKWQFNGLLQIVGGLKPGETRSVSGGTFGCGTRQNIYAKVDADNRIPESDENNNRSQTIEVKARPCSS